MSFELNPGQKMVAETLGGRVLVSAGAGTGKTRALTERFVRAVTPDADGGRCAEVDQILAITFTEKAAGEIAERIRVELRRTGQRDDAERLEGAWISTIHGFGRRLLRRHALEAGLDPGFSVADDVIGGFLSDQAMERAMAEGVTGCSRVRGFVEEYTVPEAARVVRTVAGELRTRGLTVDDLVAEPAPTVDRLLEEAAVALARAKKGFEPHSAGSAGAATNLEACAAAGERVRALDPGAQDEQEIARAIWDAMASSWPRRAGAAAVAEVAAELVEARQRLAMEAARIMLQPRLSGLKTLVGRYLTEWERLKRERGVLDFDDLQAEALRLIRDDAAIAARYRRTFKLVMVDEFQDTDELQLELIEAVSGENLCTVGDERQSIYGFRGADVEVYRRHRSTMLASGAVTAELVENYRSHPDIIGFVNRLFGAEPLFGPGLPGLVPGAREESQWPSVSARVSVDLVRAETENCAQTDQAEAEALAERFERLRQAGVGPGEMVVLLRTYDRATPVADSLRKRGFDVEVVGGSRFFELSEVSTLLSLCEVMANPLDESALARLLISDMSAISDEGVALLALSRMDQGTDTSLWGALGRADIVLDGPDLAAARGLRSVIERAIARAAAGPLARAMAIAVEESGLDLVCSAGHREGARAFANIQKLLRKVEIFERSGESGAAAFAARIRAEKRYGSTESPARAVGHGSSAVRVMSIHAAKGLEFPVVGVPFTAHPMRDPRGSVRTHAANGRLEFALALPRELRDSSSRVFADRTEWFARMQARAKEAETAEVKRQFYVACTRAREMLVLTGTLKGDKSPEEMAESPLAWSRRALGALRELPAEGARVQTLEEGVSLEVTARPIRTGLEQWDPLPTGSTKEAPREAPRPIVAGERSSVAARPVQRGAASRTPVTEGHQAPVAPTRLSATDIALHARCSLRYWAERVARFGEARAPGDRDPRAFGSALHALLQLDLPGATCPSEDRMNRIARFHGLEEASARRLRRVFDSWRAAQLRSDLHSCEQVWTEYPFVIEVHTGRDGTFEFAGAIDAWGRSGRHALVVDYKSGTETEEEGQLRDRYSDQASAYAFALLSGGLETVDLRFVCPEADGGDGSMQEVRFEFDRGDLKRLEASLLEVYERISIQPYLPLERWDHKTCASCRIAGSACPLTPPRRGSGAG